MRTCICLLFSLVAACATTDPYPDELHVGTTRGEFAGPATYDGELYTATLTWYLSPPPAPEPRPVPMPAPAQETPPAPSTTQVGEPPSTATGLPSFSLLLGPWGYAADAALLLLMGGGAWRGRRRIGSAVSRVLPQRKKRRTGQRRSKS